PRRRGPPPPAQPARPSGGVCHERAAHQLVPPRTVGEPPRPPRGRRRALLHVALPTRLLPPQPLPQRRARLGERGRELRRAAGRGPPGLRRDLRRGPPPPRRAAGHPRRGALPAPREPARERG